MEFETYTYRTKIRIGEREVDRLWTLRKNTQDEFIVKEVYEGNCYKLPDDLSGKVIVDIGANIGAFAAACVDRGSYIVWSYDPQAELATKLFSNRVVRTPAAIVGDGGPDHVYCSTPDKYYETTLTGGLNTFYPDPQRLAKALHISDVLIEILNPAALSDSTPVKNIWIKVDCEGSEYEILASDLPWDRIERIFGECHTLIDGKLSRDTAPIENGRFPIEPNVLSIVSRLESVGYKVKIVPNGEDRHLHLFWAESKEAIFERVVDRSPVNEHDAERLRMLRMLRERHSRPDGLKSGSIEDEEKIIQSDGELANAEMSKRIDEPKNVCILTPFRNARRYLPLYFRQLTSLQSLLSQNNYSLRLVAAEGDSSDGTHDRIIELANEHNIPLTMVDTTHGHMKWGSVEDPVRMRVMSEVMNRALDEVKESDSIVVWIMSDLEWRAEGIYLLICSAEYQDSNCSIFAPMIYADNSTGNEGTFYDTWAFRKNGVRFKIHPPFHVDFLKNHSFGDIVEIDSAGTCLVMRGEVARECRALNLEAVSFCQSGKDKGYCTAINLGLSVIHAPKQTYSILWISDAVCISGFSRVAHSLFPLLSEAGFDLEIIAQNYYGTPHNFPYLIWPANVNGEDPSGTLRMQNLLWANRNNRSKYDAIVVLDDPWNVPRIVKGIKHVSRLIWQEGGDTSFTPPPVISWVTVDGKNIRQSDLGGTNPVAVTEFGRCCLVCLPDKLWPESTPVVPFGVDSSIFQPLDKLECRRLTCGDGSTVPYDSFIVGTVSNNQLRKNLHLVIESFSEWVHRYGRSDAYLYLCLGKESETGCDVESLVRYYDLRGKVIVNRSALPDEILAKVYNSFDVFISLSSEGFGLCALEAMACSVPCVLSDWSGYSSWAPSDCAIKIPCSHTQLTAPLNSQAYVIGGVADKRKVVVALQKLYTFSEMREKLSFMGREVAGEFSWKNAADKLIDVLERIIEREAIKREDKHICSPENGCGIESSKPFVSEFPCTCGNFPLCDTFCEYRLAQEGAPING